ncbi:MAG: hypothetical protein IJX66_12395 [Lachnospiraceae bacterium]|nr:hypothetical protein [Lachnospiraceae bacterium]
MQLLGLKNDLEKFKNNHPRFIQFIQAIAQDGLNEGTILECKVITPEGREMQTNIKVTQEDLELFQKLKSMQ